MKYLLLVCGQDAETDAMTGCGGWVDEMRKRGVYREALGLHPPHTATTVQVRDREVMLTDGPYAETKDQVGGFSVIECADLDEAIEIAAAHPSASVGKIEIRPIREF